MHLWIFLGVNVPMKTEFPIVFESLKAILKPYAKKFIVKSETAEIYYLDGAYSEKWKKDLFFASAQVKKN